MPPARLLVALLTPGDDAWTEVALDTWIPEARRLSGTRVIVVRLGDERGPPRLEGDRLSLGCPGDDLGSAAAWGALLRFANVHLAFERLLVVAHTACVNPWALVALQEERRDFLASRRPVEPGDPVDTALDLDLRGVFGSRRFVAGAAELPSEAHRERHAQAEGLLRTTLAHRPELDWALVPGFVDGSAALEADEPSPPPVVVVPETEAEAGAPRALFRRVERARGALAGALAWGPRYHDEGLLADLWRREVPTPTLVSALRRNDPVIRDFPGLEASLEGAALDRYLASRSAEIDDRIRREYRALSPEAASRWPWSYLLLGHAPTPRWNAGNPWAETEKLATFVFCIKSRRVRTRLALRSLLRPALLRFAEVMLIEDLSPDLVDIGDLDGADSVSHFVVDTGTSWTRSGLLNFGARQARTPLVIPCDVDFLFPEDFPVRLEGVLRAVDFDRCQLAVNVFETETHDHIGGILSRGSPYGHLWVFDRRKLVALRGFEEGFVGWGHEDRELERRLMSAFGLRPLRSMQVDPRLRVLHLSHSTRTGHEMSKDNEILRARLEARDDARANGGREWGRFPLVEERRYEGGRLLRDRNGASEEVQARLAASARLSDTVPIPSRASLGARIRRWRDAPIELARHRLGR